MPCKEVNRMKQLTVGIMAHVDAGKTTLAEALLFRTGKIRKRGRVDHGDSWLDTNDIERSRGITVFAHQASLTLGDTVYTLLDTPGHVDSRHQRHGRRTESYADALAAAGTIRCPGHPVRQ